MVLVQQQPSIRGFSSLFHVCGHLQIGPTASANNLCLSCVLMDTFRHYSVCFFTGGHPCQRVVGCRISAAGVEVVEVGRCQQFGGFVSNSQKQLLVTTSCQSQDLFVLSERLYLNSGFRRYSSGCVGGRGWPC